MPEIPSFRGRCYCGEVHYEAIGKPMVKAQCHCRECQYITGGGPNYFMIMPTEGFSWIRGTPLAFARPDLETPVTRRFCGTCGTHLITELPDGTRLVLKVGTLDDPAAFGGPKAAIYTIDQQPFHLIPSDILTFERIS